VLIAEELLLVALDPVKGTVSLGARTYLNVGLAGAVLAELAIAGNLGIRDGRIVPAGDPPTDPFLAEVLAAIRSETKAAKAKSAVKMLDKQVGGVWRGLVERMVAAGTLGEAKHGRLRPTRHPVLDRPRQDSVLGGVRASAAGDGPLVPRSAVLLALTGPCRLLERVAPDRSGRRHAKTRIKEATDQAPFGPEAKQVIDELIAAVAIAAVVASTASSNG
jgi:hypothetical protein